MKFKMNRDTLKIIILLFIVLLAFYYISDRTEQYRAYSVFNKSREGLSVFYETLQELDVSAERTKREVFEHSADSIQLIAYEGYYSFDINEKEIQKWVKKGGILVCLTPYRSHPEIDGLERKEKDDFIFYSSAEGKIIIADINNLINKNIGENTDKAYDLFLKLKEESSGQIYFNENHLVSEEGQGTFWSTRPIWVKLIIYQLLLAAAAFIYFKGKRFGKTIPFFEERERIENEYIYSAAALYKKGESWDLMVENYYQDFLHVVGLKHGEWLEYWQQKNLSAFKKAQKLHEFMDKYKNDLEIELKEKKSVEIINNIEDLKRIIKRKREGYWK